MTSNVLAQCFTEKEQLVTFLFFQSAHFAVGGKPRFVVNPSKSVELSDFNQDEVFLAVFIETGSCLDIVTPPDEFQFVEKR